MIGSHLWSAETTRGSMQIPAVFVASRTSQGGEQGRRGGGSMLFLRMTPIAGNTGRVANLTLSFRAPASTERISQTTALDYAADPAETPEQPYLSAPEMAERYAMYNMFLGLRAATQSYDAGCVIALLEATRASATRWNRTHEDPDLAADLLLVDQYLANMRARVSSVGVPPVETCAAAADPDHPMPLPVDDYPDRRYYACSAGGGPGGGVSFTLVALGMFGAVGVRRRRRCSR